MTPNFRVLRDPGVLILKSTSTGDSLDDLVQIQQILGEIIYMSLYPFFSLKYSWLTAGVQLQQPGIQPEEMNGVGDWGSLSVFYGLPVYSKFKILFYTFTKTLGQRFDILSSPLSDLLSP